MRILSLFVGVALAVTPAIAAAKDEPVTSIHKPGYCAMRGQEKKSFFGGQLPVAYNGPAEEPADDVRKQLVDLCGAQWSEGPICCDSDQV